MRARDSVSSLRELHAQAHNYAHADWPARAIFNFDRPVGFDRLTIILTPVVVYE